MRGRRAGFGGVKGESEAGFGDHVDAFVGELKVANVVVVEVLGAGAVVADVMGAPAASEFVAAGGQLTDEVVEVFVVGVAAGFRCAGWRCRCRRRRPNRGRSRRRR